MKRVISIELIIIMFLTILPTVSASDYTEEDVVDAIVNVSDLLLDLQSEEGLWSANIRINPRETAYFMITAKYLGFSELEDDIKTSANWLLNHINEDGGWGFFDQGGDSDVSITAIVRLALIVNGVDEELPELKDSAIFLENNGGLKNTDIFCKTFYALFDLYKEPWESAFSEIFFPDLSILYLDNTDENSIFSMMAWGREAGIAMSIIKEYQKRENLHTKSALIKLAEDWIVSHQLEDGCWYTLLGTCMNMIALNEIDRDKHWERIEMGMNWINSQRDSDGYQRRFVLSVWDTSFVISSLRKSNIGSSEQVLLSAAKWLINAQTQGGGYNWSNVPSGGWSYNENNILYPDCDDTALAISALNLVQFASYTTEYRKRMAVQLGEDWLLYMQNDDGGWGTFSRFDGDKDFKDPTESSEDPSVGDITGHVLTALASCGYTSDDNVIQKTVEYLKKDQNDQGAWYGRWGLCYLYGTSSVLQGLNAVGYDMADEFVIKASDWLATQQNDDGGWGEHFSWWSEKNGISFTEMGPSTPEQTAWAISALMCVDPDKYEQRIENGVSYLLESQQEDGGWEHPYYTVLGLNPYKNPYYPYYFPLAALSEYADLKGIDLDQPSKSGVERQEKETFLMIDSMSYDDVAQEGDSLQTPMIEFSFEYEDQNLYRLGLYNKSKEKIEDVYVTVYDETLNETIVEYDFDQINGETRISKSISFSDYSNKDRTIKVSLEYTAKGETVHTESDYEVSLYERQVYGISPSLVISLVILILLIILVLVLVKNTKRPLIKLAIKNLARNKSRTILTFIGIVIGISATAGSISLGQSFDEKLRSDFQSFGAGRIIVLPEIVDISIGPPTKTYESASSLRLDDDVVDELKQVENVKSVCPVMNYETTVTFKGESRNCYIQFVDVDTFASMTPLKLDSGSFIQKGDSTSANVGYDIQVKAFSEDIGLGDTLKIGNIEVTVKGLFQETDGMSGQIDSMVTPNIVIYLPMEMADKFVRKDYYDIIEVKVIDIDKIQDTDDKINNVLSDKYPNNIFSTLYTEKLQDTVSEILYQFDLIISMIGLFCLVVSGIGIMNMVIVNMTERRQEIGVMMAVGASNSTIMRVLLLELLLLGTISGFVGFIGGLAVVYITQYIAQIMAMPDVGFLLGLSLFLGICIVMIFGIIPIKRELKNDPIEALR